MREELMRDPCVKRTLFGYRSMGVGAIQQDPVLWLRVAELWDDFLGRGCFIDVSSCLERCWGAVGFHGPQEYSRGADGSGSSQVWTWWSRKSLCFPLSTYSPTPAFPLFLVSSSIPIKTCIFIHQLPPCLCFVHIHLWIQKRERRLCPCGRNGRNSFLLSLIPCLAIRGPRR